MEKNKINISLVIGIVIASFIMIIGAQFLYTRYYVNAPLIHSLNKVHAVNSASLVEEKNKIIVQVNLGAVGNLPQSYQTISQLVKEKMGPDTEIRIISKPNSRLEEIKDKMDFSLQEAGSIGNYAQMYTRVEEIAKDNGLEDWNLYLDQDNIYLHLGDKNYYIYEVVPRRSEKNNVEGN